MEFELIKLFRGGNRQQFIDMVDRCKAVGVNIFVDAVINHMSGLDSEGNKNLLHTVSFVFLLILRIFL